MIAPLTALLVCQLAGEFAVRLTGIPLPGPVLGMALLFTFLLLRGRVPESLDRLTDGLLGNLSLLFVPAGVGVMLHLPLVAREWVPIAASLLVSTLATIAVTALVMRALAPHDSAARHDDNPPHDSAARHEGNPPHDSAARHDGNPPHDDTPPGPAGPPP